MNHRRAPVAVPLLLKEFDYPSAAAWRAAAEASLSGQPLDKLTSSSYEGIPIRPIYRHDDIDDLSFTTTLPGEEPFVRGPRLTGYLQAPWRKPESASQTAFGGLPQWATWPASPPHVHDLRIPPEAVNEPLGELALTGTLPLPLAAAYDEVALIVRWAQQQKHVAPLRIPIGPYHEAGANAVQELAVALATGATTLRAQLERGIPVDVAAAALRFDFAIGSHFFLEIAKLRAARLLWAQVIAAFGGEASAAPMRLETHTPRRNKSALDPHVNMLRTTTEALAAVLGSADTIYIAPFDELLGTPDEFTRRIARNVHTILRHEAHLGTLIDPAGGSYAVESLTDELARAAWALFQEIERQGGMAEALANGFVQSSIAAVADKRATALAKRRDVLVGVNQFVNPTEKPRPAAPPSDPGQPARRPSPRDDAACRHALQQLALAPPEAVVDAAVAAARAGATVDELAAVLRRDDGPRPSVTPLPQRRLAEPFEKLRTLAADYAAAHGRPPRLFLANVGPPRQHKARADFTQGFFEVGGFQVITNNGFKTPDEAAAAALASGAPAVAICSTDETYPEVVPSLVAAIKAAVPDTPVILAGQPADQVEAHRAAGVDAFIYMGADALAMNRWLLEQIAAVGANFTAA